MSVPTRIFLTLWYERLKARATALLERPFVGSSDLIKKFRRKHISVPLIRFHTHVSLRPVVVMRRIQQYLQSQVCLLTITFFPGSGN